jgi:hypothetical protein
MTLESPCLSWVEMRKQQKLFGLRSFGAAILQPLHPWHRHPPFPLPLPHLCGPGTLSQPQPRPQQQQQSFLEYDIRHTLEQFMATYHRRKIPEYGLLRLAKQFKLQGMEKEAIEYLNTVVSMNSKIVEAYLLLSTMQTLEPNVRLQFIINALMIDPDGYHVSPLLSSISPLPHPMFLISHPSHSVRPILKWLHSFGISEHGKGCHPPTHPPPPASLD